MLMQQRLGPGRTGRVGDSLEHVGQQLLQAAPPPPARRRRGGDRPLRSGAPAAGSTPARRRGPAPAPGSTATSAGTGSGCRSMTTPTASRSASRSDCSRTITSRSTSGPERLRGGETLERLKRRLGHDRVRHQIHQGLHRAGIADGAQSVDRGELKPELPAEQVQQRGHRLAAAQLSQGLDRRLGHVEVGVPRQRDDRGASRRDRRSATAPGARTSRCPGSRGGASPAGAGERRAPAARAR